MFSRILDRKTSDLTPVLFLCAALLYPFSASAVTLAQQSNQASGVSISAKPDDLSANASAWSFQIALNTHSGSLDDNLAQSATLVDAAGKAHAALGWEGDPAGGHHRKGVLRFKPISPLPEAVELRILLSGENAPRLFRWKLK